MSLLLFQNNTHAVVQIQAFTNSAQSEDRKESFHTRHHSQGRVNPASISNQTMMGMPGAEGPKQNHNSLGPRE